MKVNALIFLHDLERLKEIQLRIAEFFLQGDYRSSVTAYLKRSLLEEALIKTDYCLDLLVLPADSMGFKIGEQVREKNRTCTILYMDGSEEAILDAFYTLPIAFVPQKAQEDFLRSCLSKAVKWIEGGQSHFSYESRTELMQYPYEDIEYFESEYRVVHIHLVNQKSALLTGKLDEMEALVPKGLFCRCHKSYLVNLSHIRQVDKSTKSVTLKSGHRIYASKAGYPLLNKMLTGGDVDAVFK